MATGRTGQLRGRPAIFRPGRRQFRDKALWIFVDDGFLVLDRDGDGTINGINELFRSPGANLVQAKKIVRRGIKTLKTRKNT